MVTPEIVARAGKVDTIVCHTDFDGLASAAKWMRGGIETYPGSDDDAWAIDTRLRRAGPVGERIDRALRARPYDHGLFGLVVRHLATGLSDPSLWEIIDAAAAELIPIEAETRRAAENYVRLPPGVAVVDITAHTGASAPSGAKITRIDKTQLLLIGQEREPVSLVIDRDTVTVAARSTAASISSRCWASRGDAHPGFESPRAGSRICSAPWASRRRISGVNTLGA